MLAIIILATIAALIITIVVLIIRKIAIEAHDSRVVTKYQREMDNLRKERAWQEKEKQRKIRGEAEDAPKYAAGGDMDRITRRRY